MELFLIIVLLLIITWYSVWVHFSRKKNITKIWVNSLQLDRDIFITWLENLSIKNEYIKKISDEISQYVMWDKVSIYTILGAMLSQGHVLIQWAPGTWKTSLVKVFSKACWLQYSRIQCTPDMLPQDVLGVEIYDNNQNTFSFKSWPIFAQVVHVDEINRATPKLQSAFLEAMEEQQVTIWNTSQPLPTPFFLIATQNPFDALGTYMLPYAQIDRFMVWVYTQSLSMQHQLDVVKKTDHQFDRDNISTVLSSQEIIHMQKQIEGIQISDDLLEYAVSCVNTLKKQWFDLSIRVTKALVMYAKVIAYIQDKNMVEKNDIIMSLLPVLRHRVSYIVRQQMNDITIYDIMIWSLQKDDIAN